MKERMKEIKGIFVREHYSIKELLVVLAISVAYLLACAYYIQFKFDQLVLVILFIGCFVAAPFTKKLVLGYLIFIAYWVLFDLFNEVHTADLYFAEKRLFGISDGEKRLTISEYWQFHSHPILDVASGFFYLSWVPIPLAFGFHLFLTNKKKFLHFAISFLIINILGFAVYYLYPAAPPWYVQKFGFAVDVSTKGDSAGLARFDAFFQVPVFEAIYSKSSNVFAAVPSLHSSYPVLVLYYGLKTQKVSWNVLFAIVMIGIWFSAVYTGHHYIIDVLIGIIFAFLGILLFNKKLLKSPIILRSLEKYEKAIGG
jgi:membrane-associated phospholipid phosphatase